MIKTRKELVLSILTIKNQFLIKIGNSYTCYIKMIDILLHTFTKKLTIIITS